MRPEHVALLRCPRTGEILDCVPEETVDGRIKTGALRSSRASYPIIDFIPRFVSSDNYARNFGLEWTLHNRTQFDSDSGHAMSRDRFFKETKWCSGLSGETILEIGSGSGRFTEIALETGAIVVSLDYSFAVEANYQSNGANPNLLLVQANVYEMPFAAGSFDRAFCFGVLQHTPDPEAAFRRIVGMIKPDGRLAADIYIKNFARFILPLKYWVRPFTRGADPHWLYAKVRRYVDVMWPLARIVRRIPAIGPSLNWKLLIADYSQHLDRAEDATLKEWAYLDTFDMLSPRYDFPQTVSTFRRWFEQSGLTEIDVHKGYNGVEGRARIPQQPDPTLSTTVTGVEEVPA